MKERKRKAKHEGRVVASICDSMWRGLSHLSSTAEAGSFKIGLENAQNFNLPALINPMWYNSRGMKAII